MAFNVITADVLMHIVCYLYIVFRLTISQESRW